VRREKKKMQSRAEQWWKKKKGSGNLRRGEGSEYSTVRPLKKGL